MPAEERRQEPLTEQRQQVAEAPPAPEPAAAEVGAPSGMPRRDPMSLLRMAAPLLSMEAYEDEAKPLDDLRDAAGRSEDCLWNRVRPRRLQT